MWKFTVEVNDNTCNSNKEIEDTLKLESKKLTVVKQNGLVCNYIIQLETIISGHDGWIYGVHWKPNFHLGISKKKYNYNFIIFIILLDNIFQRKNWSYFQYLWIKHWQYGLLMKIVDYG